ncbi:DUF1801 domain-containing protein [Massilibacteroides sp.]|uniref:iron chaperone n=1 Tax=Massilibacteroides sp. TaxID=2034766 RepID=UPI0026064816|nr:DUF1801 domain-containing protein [Massilibacteroides sp.]MDD4516153.1 DUF1801 domain-containing protein [Massilibacteroides sp.]
MNEQKPKTETIDQYISEFSEDIQAIMQHVRQTILDAAPEAKETISWGMPTFKVKKILVQFAGHKQHLGFYPWPETIEAFKDKLTSHKTSKGGIQFPYNRPIPLELISEMVRFRLKTLQF